MLSDIARDFIKKASSENRNDLFIIFIITLVVFFLGISALAISFNLKYMGKEIVFIESQYLIYFLRLLSSLFIVPSTLFLSVLIFKGLYLLKGPFSKKLDKIFYIRNASDFYDLISSFYEENNSPEYIKTLVKIRKLICENSENNKISICDLGGGTGQLIDYFPDESVDKWVNIDDCNGMNSVFKKRDLNEKIYSCQKWNIENLKELLFFPKIRGEFNVVILSHVISSMVFLPNFQHIKELLKNNGLLVIADAHSEYSEGKFYDVRDKTKKKNYALKIKPIDHDNICNIVENKGFTFIEREVIEKERKIYSVISIYRLTN